MRGVDGGFADAADEDGRGFGELLDDADAVAHIVRLLVHSILQLSYSISHLCIREPPNESQKVMDF